MVVTLLHHTTDIDLQALRLQFQEFTKTLDRGRDGRIQVVGSLHVQSEGVQNWQVARFTVQQLLHMRVWSSRQTL
jgi:hypothetical protein